MISRWYLKKKSFLNTPKKSQAGHVLKLFLNFWPISASVSYKLGSYKIKRVYSVNESCNISIFLFFVFFFSSEFEKSRIPILKVFCLRNLFIIHLCKKKPEYCSIESGCFLLHWIKKIRSFSESTRKTDQIRLFFKFSILIFIFN